MKVAVVYNRQSQSVINLFGIPNREKYGLKAIKRITEALRKGRHQVLALEGDKDLVRRLEEFMPRVVKGERPGMVFNLSYGIQGQARYTHVPGILEMLGVPYVGSGPLAHSLSLDKVVAKMLFKQHGLPTPDFAVLSDRDFAMPDLPFPLIVKPRHESTSFGLRVVEDPSELRAAADVIFEQFGQEVLVEQYIDGREINVGILGNNPGETFEPAEVHFDVGPAIYTLEDKRRKSGREIRFSCPAELEPAVAKEARRIALKAFQSLGCADCARVDMRLDREGRLFILEINSLPSLGEHGSYTMAAATAGLDFAGLVNRLVEVASARYFGTPKPPDLTDERRNAADTVFSFVTARRERMENRLKSWVGVRSRTDDPIGIGRAFEIFDGRMKDLGLVRTDWDPAKLAGLWETEAGLDTGTLLLSQIDVTIEPERTGQGFRREPERLAGEGVGLSRAQLVCGEFALRALKAAALLRKTPLGWLVFGDDGVDCRHSADFISHHAARAGQVLVLRPSAAPDQMIVGRRGQRRYRFRAEGDSRRLGTTSRKPDILTWVCKKIPQLEALSDRKSRIAVGVTNIRSQNFPTLLPHEVTAEIVVSYPSVHVAESIEEQIRDILGSGPAIRWEIARSADRPPMIETAGNKKLAKQLVEAAEKWDIPLSSDTSVTPSVAGLVPKNIPVVCGLGPFASELHTPNESLHRISLVQRTLILAGFLARWSEELGT